MNVELSINGENMPLSEKYLDDDMYLSLEMPENRSTIHCGQCGELGDGTPESPEADDADDCTEEQECPDCEGTGESGDDEGEECPKCAGTGEIPADHEWELLPLSWLESAGIEISQSSDQVRLNVSVGDPRGCFTMELRWSDTHGLLMRLPHEGMSTPHVPLRELHPGTYVLGS